jgi:hypothetical protein
MAKRPAQLLVALSRQVENVGIAAFTCAPSPARYARRGVRSATTWNQARGGARDRNAARRGETKMKLKLPKCSMVRDANGAGKSGASGKNDDEARWIVAQIAQ